MSNIPTCGATDRRRSTLTAVAALAGLVTLGWVGSDAFAQPSRPEAVPPAGSLEAPPEKIEPGPPIGAPGSSQGTLSEQLEKSSGVIKPPADVDPSMVVPPPNAGTSNMPVIPPPGTPGGNPRVDPK